jgi:hypothetical protein
MTRTITFKPNSLKCMSLKIRLRSLPRLRADNRDGFMGLSKSGDHSRRWQSAVGCSLVKVHSMQLITPRLLTQTGSQSLKVAPLRLCFLQPA